jgi:hypothetical protein
MEIKLKPNEINEFKYDGSTSLKNIEDRLLEIEHEKEAGVIINKLTVEKEQLRLQRQFILDRRNSWKAKSVWNIIVPIVVSVMTTHLLSLMMRKMRTKILILYKLFSQIRLQNFRFR